MWEEHGGRKPSFTMRVMSKHKSPLGRLTQEAVNILALSRDPEGVDLNAKSEWGQACIPHISVAMPNQMRPGINPNQDSNPVLKFYMMATAGMDRTGKREIKLAWN